jgi:DNA polymerase-3 subunit delta
VRSFAASDRFVADVKARKMAPGYVFIGDEAFFRKRCRDAILQHLVPADVRELSVYDMDLSEVELQHILDQARTPSLMSPFQVFFIRGVKNLYGRGNTTTNSEPSKITSKIPILMRCSSSWPITSTFPPTCAAWT